MSAVWAPQDVRLEHRTDGARVLAVGPARPRVSWRSPTAPPGHRQSGYEIELSRPSGRSVHRVASADQILVPWPGEPLVSRESVTVRVRVAAGAAWSRWSEPVVVEAGLLRREDWKASLVSPRGGGGRGDPAPLLIREVEVPPDRTGARLYLTSWGVHAATINGHRVGDVELDPGWTSYHHRLRYRAHDVTDLLVTGTNRLEALLGNGWYRGRLGWSPRWTGYGDRVALLAQLEITTGSGRLVIGTDLSWRWAASGVLQDDLYDGQRTDLRVRPAIDTPLGEVDVLDGPAAELVAPDGPPVRVLGTVPGVATWASASGGVVIDLGRNVVGRLRIRVRALPAGTEVVARHAEVVDRDGELVTRPLRTARATDSWFVAGHDEEVLEPGLTFHGFRYAEVLGVPGLTAEDVEAAVIGSDLPRLGWFGCSDPDVETFHENAYRSLQGNTIDVPTDCPQRDERFGWTGDIQLFAPAATFLADVSGFLGSWTNDLAAEQWSDGSVPYVVPDVLRMPTATAAGWGDAAVVVPWVLYQRTGDEALLRRRLPSMQAWVERVAADAGPSLVRAYGHQFGDWLDPVADPAAPWDARTPPDVMATAQLARSADLVARTATVLGEDAVARRHTDLAEATRSAFAHEFVTPGGRVIGDSQTAYAMAITWGLIPDGAVDAAGRRLADLVRTAGFRIATGFVGTPLVCEALALTGHVDVAYRLLLQRGCPSWLYPVTRGATTIWERWDALRPDGSVNPGRMTSFNHYAFGAIVDWLHRHVAGLAPGAPGYRVVEARPRPAAGLTSAWARHRTPYGEAEVGWTRAGSRLELVVTVPVGATATVLVPGTGEPSAVGPGRHHWSTDDPVPPLPPPTVLRDVMDDPTRWAAVVGAAVAAGAADGEPTVARHWGRYLDAPLDRILIATDPLGHAQDARALGIDLEAIVSP